VELGGGQRTAIGAGSSPSASASVAPEPPPPPSPPASAPFWAALFSPGGTLVAETAAAPMAA
jgi:hypothetical protein